jgi:hypothetical protein
MLGLGVTACPIKGAYDIQSQVRSSCMQYVDQLMLFEHPPQKAQDSYSDKSH